MVKASDNEFPSVLFEKSVDPATPSTGNARVFIDSADDVLKWIDDDGTVYPVDPTTTKGDLLVNNGTNLVRVGVGSNDQVLTADSAESAGVKWAAGGGGGGTTFSGASVHGSANDTGINGDKTITWNSEHFDTDDYHDNSTNNTRLTVPDTAYYRVSWTIYIQGVSSGLGYEVEIDLNGTTEYKQWLLVADNTGNLSVSGSRIFSLTADDYVELTVETDDTNWTFVHGSNLSVFQIEKLGT